MKAEVPYNDLRGTAAADISPLVSGCAGGNLEAIESYFNVDRKRFRVVAVSIDGTREFSLSLICVDKVKSTQDKEHLVSLSVDTVDDKKIISILLESLHIVLHDDSDKRYSSPDLNYDEEAFFSDFHQVTQE